MWRFCTQRSLVCFCLMLPGLLFTQTRETHWVQLLRSIWPLLPLTHRHCCFHQPSPAAALMHHAVSLNAQQGQFAETETSIWILSLCLTPVGLQHFFSIISPASGTQDDPVLCCYLIYQLKVLLEFWRIVGSNLSSHLIHIQVAACKMKKY